jgi:hypothetical protein
MKTKTKMNSKGSDVKKSVKKPRKVRSMIANFPILNWEKNVIVACKAANVGIESKNIAEILTHGNRETEGLSHVVVRTEEDVSDMIHYLNEAGLWKGLERMNKDVIRCLQNECGKKESDDDIDGDDEDTGGHDDEDIDVTDAKPSKTVYQSLNRLIDKKEYSLAHFGKGRGPPKGYQGASLNYFYYDTWAYNR